MPKRKIKEDVSTEEKIKEAARRLFTERGFDAVRTRDIAEEAGINLALLNYYFRSKEKLFDIVMLENFQQFVAQLIPVLSDESLSLDEILAKVAETYIEMLRSNPDLPFFVLDQMRNDTSKIKLAKEEMIKARESFMNRVERAMKEGKIAQVNMGHFMMNFMGLVILPFVAKSILMKVNNINQKEFDALVEERKKLVPIWLKAIMTSPPNPQRGL